MSNTKPIEDKEVRFDNIRTITKNGADMKIKDYNSIRKLYLRFLWIVSFTIVTSSIEIYAQTNPNSITFENKSGELGLVKVIGPTEQIVEVPDKQSRTVNVAAGEYYILVRYGTNPEDYKYSKGEPFKVIQTATEYSENIITLHKVVDGNYTTKPISSEEFNAFKIDLINTDQTNNYSNEIKENNEVVRSDKSKWLLVINHDERKLLEQIGNYIEEFYSVAPTYFTDKNENKALIYDQMATDSTSLTIYVQVISLQKIEHERVITIVEQRIKVSIFIDVSEFINKGSIRNKILELNNKWHNENWMPHRIFIADDNYIAFQSSLNISGVDFPIPAEQVKDAITRTIVSVENYSVKLKEILNKQNASY